MYIIEEGKAYLVDGKVGYQINFDITGKMLVNKEETIDVRGKVLYSYDEMYRKLNIKYKINKAKQEKLAEEAGNEFIEELKSKIEELTKENEELKAELELVKNKEVETEEESKKLAPVDTDLENSSEDEPKEKNEPKDENNKKENK